MKLACVVGAFGSESLWRLGWLEERVPGDFETLGFDGPRTVGFGVPDGEEEDTSEIEDLAEAGVRGDLNILSSLVGVRR